ncbi:MAG: PilZ domain-containing protein [Rhizobiaceae bacterium]
MQKYAHSTLISKIMANKRESERVKSAFTGSIHADGLFYSHCIIRDVSNSGMKLEVSAQIELPEQFEVKTPAMQGSLPVRQAWRKHKEVGVEYLPLADDGSDEKLAS